MSDEYDPLQDGELEDEDAGEWWELDLDGWELDILANMPDPPAEAYEMSYLRARDILEDAGPESGILLLTVRFEGDDLASRVVLSSGYQEIPTDTLLEILNTHLGAM